MTIIKFYFIIVNATLLSKYVLIDHTLRASNVLIAGVRPKPITSKSSPYRLDK